MKWIVLTAIATLPFISCGGDDAKKSEQQAEVAKQADPALEEKALELIGSKGCTACHAIDKKLIGPAYIDVSKKYEATEAIIDTLAHKVINGGKGVWGEVPMTANNVTPEEAKMVVTYILSLKNQ
jgi:cytochrome c